MRFDVIVLDGRYNELPSQGSSLLAAARRDAQFTFSGFLSRIHTLLGSTRIRDVLVVYRSSFRVPGFSVLEEIGAALSKLRDAGKSIHFYAESYTEASTYLASYASKRYMHPVGAVRLLGHSASFLYFRTLLDRFGIEPIVTRRGRYKSGADSLVHDRLQEPDAEQVQRILDVTDGCVAARLRSLAGSHSDTTVPPDSADGLFFFAQEAVDRGWVHELKTEQQILHEWRQAKAKQARHRSRPLRYGSGQRIAVLVIEGTITDGESRSGEGLHRAAGARTIAKCARRLQEDKRLKGVVVRINSPGGSATGSEVIRRSLLSLAEKKAVVVSFGAVAASGGYWISALGTPIYAGDTTLTGSIGAFTLYPNLQSLLHRIGVRSDKLRTSPHADFPSSLRPPDAVERSYLEREVDDVYRHFLERVSESRGLELDIVDERAQGRVWSGIDAVDNELVDHRGGLADAIEALKSSLNVKRARVTFYPEIKRSLLGRIIAKGKLDSATLLEQPYVRELASSLELIGPLALLEPHRPHALALNLPHIDSATG